MALDWKVISQRSWLKGLQATFVRFSQPQGIIVRLSNLLYDRRGGFRTTDGSQIFTRYAGANTTQGPITELVLYSPAGQPPYYVGTMETTSGVNAYLLTAGTWTPNFPTFSTVIGSFPAAITPPLGSQLPGSPTPPIAAGNPNPSATAQGGVSGATQPCPQIIEFANKLIFALGNGYPPQEYLDTASGGSGSTTAVSNTFNAQYPDWQPNVSWSQGNIIHDSVSGGLFAAQQTGTSGATRPAFHNTLNAFTPELSPGTVQWKCIATSATGSPLRGAANALVYAGSLWLGNTWPTTTTDQLDGPNCLKMSDVNNPESWNPANIAFLSKDDGDQITALATYTIAQSGISPTGSLVVFKNFSTFQVTGVFGASDFAIQQAQTDMGCIASRSVSFIPGYGLMRFTHLGFAYFNGVNDKLTSEEIRPYIFGGPPDIAPLDWNYVYLSKGAQSADPPMYVCACPIEPPLLLTGITLGGVQGSSFWYVRVEKLVNEVPVSVTPESKVQYGATAQVTVTTPAAVPGVTYRVWAGSASGSPNYFIEQASFSQQTVTQSQMTQGFTSFGAGGLTRIFAYDLVIKQWAVVDLPFAISALKQIRTPGTVPITVAGGANDGAVRRMFAGDQTWDNVQSSGTQQISWYFRSGELFQQGGSAKMFYRRVVLRGLNNLNVPIVVTVNLQGNDRVVSNGIPRTVLGGPAGATQWEMRIDIMRDAENANAKVSGSGPAQICLESMDWYTKPKPSGAPVTIQR